MGVRGLLFACLLGVTLPAVYAQPASTDLELQRVPTGSTPSAPAEPSKQDRLGSIVDSIKAAEAELAAHVKGLKSAPQEGGAEAGAKSLKDDIERLSRRLDELHASFEELATGGASIAELGHAVEQKPLDWKQEIEEIVRPLLEELKRLTERPRVIERLRSERAVIEDRLQTADRAIARIGEALQGADSPAVKKKLTNLEKQWRSHREDAASRLQLVSVQLDQLLAPEEQEGQGIAAALQEFFSGRGLSIALAVMAFALGYGVLIAVGRAVGRNWPRRYQSRGRSMAKAAGILFRVFSLVIAVFAAMAVLYVRGDWLILGLLILFLFGLALTLRQSLPRYVQEVRMLLNVGGVREDERVVYKGIPWRIKSLNVHSTLHNPLLRGGTVRVPIEDMVGLQSRQYTKEEPWFPSREGDFVMLEGEVFGKVLLQTPELVQVQVLGATTTYAVADYLSQKPRNLSLDGFAIPIVFGLDYRHQGEVLGTVVPEMRAYLEEHLASQVFAPHLTTLLVEFNEAATSSLNVLIVGVFQAAAAEHYWAIRRFLQRTAVAACNEHGWTIPFEQLTVHLEPASA